MLYDHAYFLIILERVHYFVSLNDVIENLPSFHISSLLLKHKSYKKGLESIYNNFRDDFVYYIIEGYGSKLI